MAGRIPPAFIDELIARADIVEVVNARVPLKKAGREFRACCPFHNEKTPSFWVSPAKQFFHCFGCGAHGTTLGFLMQYEQLPFVEAVEELAGRLGLTVPRDAGAAQVLAPTEGQSELLARVAGFYEECLQANPRAREYARQRGLAAETLARFRIGYAPDSWNEVLKRFGATEESRANLLATGMIKSSEQTRERSDPYYDHFRDRLMFPIRDARGRMLGFGGRVLDRGEPKYLNSPESALFHKGQELYGAYELRQSRVSLRRLLIVEGYMDVVRLHQAGVTYAVATLGTATTPEHLKRAFRLVSELVFCFDGDQAGRAAAWRALQSALPEVREGRELRFMFLPDGEDPDSLVGKEGREAFEQRLASALPLSEYLLAHLRAEVDWSHAEGQARYVSLLKPLLHKLGDPVYRELLQLRVARELNLDHGRLALLLQSDAERAGGRGADEAPAPTAGAVRSERSAGGERGTPMRRLIRALLHEPLAAAAVSAAQVAALLAVQEPGCELLHAMLLELRARPATHMAQVLLRFQDHAAFVHLDKLAQEERLLDGEAAQQEFAEGLTSFLASVANRAPLERQKQLEMKLASGTLTAAEHQELVELQRLVKDGGRTRPGRDPPPSKHRLTGPR